MTNEQLPIPTPTTSDVLYRLPHSHRGHWQLFLDWCRAINAEPLPASTLTVARFLDVEPDLSRATLRRKVSAINAAHRTGGHTPPGTATAIAHLLSARDRHAATALAVIGRLPVSGWPAGLFGRRDALLLTLVCRIGLPISTVGTLRCSDITIDSAAGALQIGQGHHITAPLDATNPYGLHAVWSRWAYLRDLTLRRPSPTAWAPALHHAPARGTAPPVTMPKCRDPDAVLFPAFDRWGNPTAPVGDSTQGLSPRAVSAIVHTHLRAAGRPVTTRTRWTNSVLDRTAGPGQSHIAPVRAVKLDDTYDDGINARRRAAVELEDLDDLFDTLDHQMAALLARTQHLLSQTDTQ